METLHFTFNKFQNRPLQIFLLAALAILILLPIRFSPFSGNASLALAQSPPQPNNLRDSYRDRLSKEQQLEIIEKNVRIRKLQEGIIDHKVKILGSKLQERSLLGDLEKIEKELQVQKKMLATLKADSENQEMLLADKQVYLRQVLTEKRAHQIHVKNRLASYYRMGSVGLMNVVFSSESLPELMDFKEYFGLMVQHDHTIIQKYLAQIRESNRAREDHAREKLRLMQITADVKDKEQQLNRIREEKNILLKQVNTEQHLYEQAVAEIEKAAGDLAATLKRLRTAAEAEPVAVQRPEVVATKKKKLPQPPVIQEGFPAQKGLLDPPVLGILITRFGQKVQGKFDSSTIAKGIDIKVKNGMEIKAVYAGKIIHSGYLRGYGNLLIIDHGHQYFSLISRAADYYKKEGTRVAKDETIGMTGEGDPLYGEGLHFEIRKGSKPEDPLLWLKKNALQIEAPQTEIENLRN